MIEGGTYELVVIDENGACIDTGLTADEAYALTRDLSDHAYASGRNLNSVIIEFRELRS